MSEAPAREWRFYLEDMQGFCDRIFAYTDGCDFHSFVEDRMRYDASLRNLELIGEAATHLPEAVRAAEPQIPWRKIIATRNRLVHAYLGIDNDVLWSIIQDDIAPLSKQIAELRSRS